RRQGGGGGRPVGGAWGRFGRSHMTARPTLYDPDAPLRLKVAAEVAFPDGSMSASGLRREADRGRLVIERIAGKDYVTLNASAEMRKLCVAAKARACGSNLPDETRSPDRLSNRPSGTSSTPGPSAALAAARAKLTRLKNSSPAISPASLRRASGT